MWRGCAYSITQQDALTLTLLPLHDQILPFISVPLKATDDASAKHLLNGAKLMRMSVPRLKQVDKIGTTLLMFFFHS